MAEPTPTPDQPGLLPTLPDEPVVLPDVATSPHPFINPAEPPAPIVPADDPNRRGAPSPLSPVGGYVRELQREFQEQEEEGKL